MGITAQLFLVTLALTPVWLPTVSESLAEIIKAWRTK